INKNLRVEPKLPEHLPDQPHRIGGVVPAGRAESDLVDADLPRGHPATLPHSVRLANSDLPDAHLPAGRAEKGMLSRRRIAPPRPPCAESAKGRSIGDGGRRWARTVERVKGI